jgi:hypothetical protein
MKNHKAKIFYWAEHTEWGALGFARVVGHTETMDKQELTNFVKQSPSWEAGSRKVAQEIPSLLCNLMVHYSVHKGPLLDYISSDVNPAHILTAY